MQKEKRTIKTSVSLPPEFLNDIPNLNSNAIKTYIPLKYLREETRKNHPNEDFAWVYCSYEFLMDITGIKSRTGIRDGIMVLAKNGWITGFRRGGFKWHYPENADKYKEMVSNSYKIPDTRGQVPPHPLLLAELENDVKKYNKIMGEIAEKNKQASPEAKKMAIRDLENMFGEDND